MRLANGVVDFVRPGVVQVFALQKDLGAAHLAAHAGRMVDRRRAANKVCQLGLEFGDEGRVVLVFGVSLFEFVDGVGQGFADEAATVNAKVPAGIGLLIVRHGRCLQKGLQIKADAGHRPDERLARNRESCGGL